MMAIFVWDKPKEIWISNGVGMMLWEELRYSDAIVRLSHQRVNRSLSDAPLFCEPVWRVAQH